MKNLVTLLFVFFLYSSSGKFNREKTSRPCYSSDYVEVATVKFNNEKYNAISMKRDGNRIKAKYFAAPDKQRNSVYKRYESWAKGKDVVLVSSGTYMNAGNSSQPEGLTIDNGIAVNETLIFNKMDALVIVYATGGIAVSNLKNGDLTVQGGTIDPKRKLNLRNSAYDKEDFIEWASSEEATVFQTHLLAYKNELKIDAYTSSDTKRERRFLAVGTNDEGKLVHVVVNCPAFSSLYEGSKKALEFLKDFKEMNVTFMINLDTGMQNVFNVYNTDGSLNKEIKGTLELNQAVNLLAYYYQ